MSTTDPEPSDPPPPPKKPRTKASRLSKDSSEKNLWDFDVIDPESAPSEEEVPVEPEIIDLPKPRSKAPRSVTNMPPSGVSPL